MKTLYILVLSAAVLLIASDARSIQDESEDENELVDAMLKVKRELEAQTDLDAALNEEESKDLAEKRFFLAAVKAVRFGIKAIRAGKQFINIVIFYSTDTTLSIRCK
ncbi:GATA type zinc finger protein asd-4-like [Acipenser oxyrinchus oxyrinchus]|uniref:GATA type zinc finger protein asd-4-like n=1 Tax=Acipenser oxyrinchus oxyrinchus TaxID=40147 RepID=A0AAD8CHD3_ACIOX|nr:GATA type zinc finger protein asd-4-like [Acipenser oxyrinchus oxyrinchus]